MKAMGASKVASLGYSISPSSSAAAKSNSKYAVPTAGLEAVYTNTTVDFGTTDVGALVLGIKKSGADAALRRWMRTRTSRSRRVSTERRHDEGEVMAPATASNCSTSRRGTNRLRRSVFTQCGRQSRPRPKRPSSSRPTSRSTPATPASRTSAIYTGYVDCDLAIAGSGAGQEPRPKHIRRRPPQTRPRQAGDGLVCQPLDLSLETYGQPPTDELQLGMMRQERQVRASSSPRAAESRTGPAN